MIKQGDTVASDGRIEVLQDGRPRFIQFDAATVLEVEGNLITVNPVGKQAILICHSSTLIGGSDDPSLQTVGGSGQPEYAEQPETVGLPQTPVSEESAREIAEEAKQPEPHRVDVQPVDVPVVAVKDVTPPPAAAKPATEPKPPTLKRLAAKPPAARKPPAKKPVTRRRRKPS